MGFWNALGKGLGAGIGLGTGFALAGAGMNVFANLFGGNSQCQDFCGYRGNQFARMDGYLQGRFDQARYDQSRLQMAALYYGAMGWG